MLIGISKSRLHDPWDPALVDRLGVSEWDAAEITSIPSRSRTRLKKACAATGHKLVLSCGLSRADETELERLRIYGEVLHELDGMALLLRPRQALLDEWSGLASVLRALAGPDLFPDLWIDPGQNFPAKPPIAGTHWVADPLWHPRQAWQKAKILKCHGWHESRWIRYYGTEQLRLIAQRAAKASVLLFGHSKRDEEALSLIELKSADTRSRADRPKKPRSMPRTPPA